MKVQEHTCSLKRFEKALYSRQNHDNIRFLNNIETVYKTTHSEEIDALAATQTGAIRRYTQLTSATSAFNLSEFPLDGVLLLRENLGASMQIEAAPPEHYVPIGAMVNTRRHAQFCGQDFEPNMLLQASGGVWDLSFKGGFEYVACVLDKSILEDLSETFLQHDIPKAWLASQPRKTNARLLHSLTQKVDNAFSLAKRYPYVFKHTGTRQFITHDIIHCAIKVLGSTQRFYHTLPAPSRRKKAVTRVMDYLKVHLADLPSISELCQVAQVSERTLEYAFKEHFGVSPTKYMNLLRLNRVRHDLRHNDVNQFGVTEVALSWGFSDLGRFSKYYHALFKELPSHTLRKKRAQQKC